MSGIEIDVSLRGEGAKKDLDKLSQGMKALAQSSKLSGNAIDRINPKVFKNVQYDVKKTDDIMKRFKGTSTDTFQNLERSAAKTSDTIDSIKKGVVGLVAAFAAFSSVNSFNKAGDNLTNLQNKLRLVTKSTEELLITQNKLFASSQDARASFKDTASLYATFAKSLQSSGVSSERVIKVVNTLQKGVALSGSSAESASAAFVQLGQGISSGTLRGEELNSVLEQIPYIGQGIAKSLKVTTGELRAMGAAGSLEPKRVLAALEDMAASADKDFARTMITATDATNQLGQSMSLFFGELNQRFGASEKYGKRILSLANYFSEASQLIGAEAYLVRQNAQNFIDGLNLYSATELTLKAAMKFNITPMDVIEKYKFYSAAKHAMSSVKDFFKTKPNLTVDTGGVTLTGLEPQVSGIDANASGFSVLVSRLKSLGKGLVGSLDATAYNLRRLVPVIQTPFVDLSTTITNSLRKIRFNVDAWLYQAIIPASRAIEAFAQEMTLFSIGDNKVERAWVNLFKSTNIDAFIGNLNELNRVRKQIRWDDKTFFGAEMLRNIRGASYDVQDVLIQLGLMDNKLLHIRDSRLDRVGKYVADIGRVTKRVYQDVFATTIEPIVFGLLVNIENISSAFLDAISDMFNQGTGKSIADSFFDGMLDGAMSLFRAWDHLESVSIWDKLFGGKQDSSLWSKTKATMLDFGQFIQGFFVELWTRVSHGISSEAFSDAFDRIKAAFVISFTKLTDAVARGWAALSKHFQGLNFVSKFGIDSSSLETGVNYIVAMYQRIVDKTAELSSKARDMVYKFGESIKSIFFEVYDAVVGHSYWPDLVDEVNAYTEKLFESESTIQRFGKAVMNAFKGFFAMMQRYGLQAGGVIADFTIRLSNVDMGNFFSVLRKNSETAIVSALLLAFGGARAKLVALSYFSTLLNGALNTAFDVFAPALGEAAGHVLVTLVHHSVEAFRSALDSFIQLAPSLVDGLLGSFAPFADTMVTAFSWLPLVSNNLVTAGVAAAGLLAIFSKGARGSIWELLAGKEGKKNKAGVITGKKDGLVDYVGAMLGRDTSNVGVSLIDKIFASKKLAIAGAVALSSSLLESVSLIEAAEIGLPLLAFALLGKDGGGRLATQAVNVTGHIAKAAYLGGLAALAKVSGTESIIYKLFDAPRGLASRVSAKQRGPIGDAFAAMWSDVHTAADNMRANASKYNAGKIGFMDMFLVGSKSSGMGSGGTTKTRLDIQKSFNGILDAFSAVSIGGGKTLGGVVNAMIGQAMVGFGRFTVFLQNFKNTVSKIMTKGWSAIVAGLSLLADGLKGLFGIILNRYALFAVLALGLGSTAFAASDASSAIGVMTTNSQSLLDVVEKLTVGFAAMGVAFRVYNAFNAASATFKSMKAGTFVAPEHDVDLAAFRKKKAVSAEAELADLVAVTRTGLDKKAREVMKKSVFATEAERLATQLGLQKATESKVASVRDGFMKARAATELTELVEFEAQFATKQARLAKIAASNSSFTAGFVGLSGYFSDVFRGIERTTKTSMAKIKKIMTGESGSTSIGNSLRKTLETTFSVNPAAIALMVEGTTKLVSALKSIKDLKLTTAVSSTIGGLGDIAGGLGGLFTGVFKSLKKLNVKSAFGGFLEGAGTAFAKLGGLVSKVFSKVMPFLLKGGIIGAVVSGVGLLSLHFFGPGTSFIDNLEWAHDKIRSIMGLQATTKSGRREEVNNNIGGTQAIGDRKVSFASDIRSVDFSKLSDAQFKVVQETSAATKEGLANLNEAYIKQGGWTQENLDDLSRLQKEMKEVFTRLPHDATQTLAGASDAFNLSMLSVSTSMWDVLRNWVGLSPIMGTIQDSTDWVAKSFSALEEVFMASGSAVSYIIDRYTSIPALIGGAIGAFFGPLGAIVGASLGALLSAAFDGLKSAIVGFGNWIMDTAFVKHIEQVGKKIGDGVSNMADNISKSFDDWVAANSNKTSPLKIEQTVGINKMIGTLPQYASNLSTEAQDELRKAYDATADSAERWTTLIEEGARARNSDNLEDFTKKLQAANVEYANNYVNLKRLTDQYGWYAEALGRTKDITTQISKMAGDAKQLFEIDMGTDGAKFVGSDQDLAAMKAYIEGVRGFKEQLKTTYDLAERRKITLNIDDIGDQAKELWNRVQASMSIAKDVEIKTKMVPDVASADDLKRLFYIDPATYNSLSGVTIEYGKLQTQFDNINADTPVSEIQRLITKMQELRGVVAANLPLMTSFDQINNALQASGGTAISGKLFGSLSDSSLMNISALSKQIGIAKGELQDLYKTGGSQAAQAALLKQIEDKQKTMLGITQAQKISNAQGFVDNKSLGNVTKAYGVAQALGVEMPEGIRKSKSAMLQWAIIQIAMAAKQKELNGEIDKGAEGSESQMAALGAQLVNLQTQLDAVTDTSVLSFDSLISKLQETGLNISDLGFSRLPAQVQKSVAGIGVQLEALSKHLNVGAATGVVGESLTAVMAKREALLKQARMLIVSALHATGAGITEGLGRIGLSDMQDIAGIAKERIQVLLGLDKQLTLAKLTLNDTSDLDGYVTAIKRVSDLERATARAVRNASHNFTAQVQTINDVFATGLDEQGMARMGGDVIRQLTVQASVLKDALEDAIHNGLSASGESVGEIFIKMRAAARTGQAIAFFADVAKNMEDALTNGAKTAFDSLSQILGDLAPDFEAFAMIPDKLSQAYSEQAVALDAYQKALNLPGLTPELAGILDQVDKPIQQILDEFNTSLGGSLGSAFTTPTQQLIMSQDDLRKSIDNLAGVTQNGGKAGGAGGTATGTGALSGSARPTLEAFRRFDTERAKLAGVGQDLSQKGAKSLADQVKAALGGTGKGLVDNKAINLANKAQLLSMLDLANKVKQSTIDLNMAIQKGDPTAAIQQQVDDYQAALKELSDGIGASAAAMHDAGKSFAASITSNFNEAFTNLLKGKADDNNTVLGTFLDSILDNVTNSILDAFTKGLLDPLTGDNGILTAGLAKLGEMVYGGINPVGQAAAGGISNLFGGGGGDKTADTVKEGTAATVGALDSITSVFSDGFASIGTTFMDGLSGLGGMLGKLDFGGIASSIGSFNWAGAFASAASFFADGGMVSGPGGGRSDAIPAMISNGEFIVNAAATKRHAGLLNAINNGRSIGHFADGGLVSTRSSSPMIGSTPTPLARGNMGTTQEFNIHITGDISRQTKQEVLRMLPQIATGVNQHNREKNFRG
jgi:tape measure domain-containing protein